MLRVRSLARREARHTRVGDLLDRDVWSGKERSRLVPDSLVERERVGEEAVRAAVRVTRVSFAPSMPLTVTMAVREGRKEFWMHTSS